MQYGGLLAARNRRVSIINSNPLWGPRQNLAVPAGMVATVLVAIVNLYGAGFHVIIQSSLRFDAFFWRGLTLFFDRMSLLPHRFLACSGGFRLRLLLVSFSRMKRES